MGFFSRQKHRIAAIAASFAMLLGVMTGVHGQVSSVSNQEGATTSLAKVGASKAPINLGIDGLSVETSGSGSYTPNGNSISCDLTSSEKWVSKSGKLVFTSSFDDARLSFTVSSFSSYKGSVSISGESSLAEKKEYSYRLSSSTRTKEVTLSTEGVKLTEGSISHYARIVISNISLTEIKTYSSIFVPDLENGSLKVDGSLIKVETTKSKESSEYYTLEFTPNSSVTFVGWEVDGVMTSSANPFQFYAKKNGEKVKPVVADPTIALFSVGGVNYASLTTANNVANSGSEKTILVSKSGVLGSGSYTISSDVSLMVPNSDEAKLSDYAKEDPVYVTNSGETPKLFRKLQLSDGVSITVKGQIVVCAKPLFKGPNDTGIPTGAYGLIDMASSAVISLESGAKFYAWGFVTGAGMVWAKSGSTVYEMFQITSWRGGTASQAMNNSDGKSKKVFIINQYYIQNIEAKLKIEAGATERTITGMHMSKAGVSDTANPCFTFIGSGGMFNMESGYLIKYYDPSSDRLKCEIHGNGSLSSLSFKISLLLIVNVDFNSADYVLPITNNISIEIKEGYCSINQDLAFIPGSELVIDQGATFEVSNGHNMTFYDQDSWGAFAVGCTFQSVTYTPTTHKTRSNADLVDAKLIVNGTLKVGSKAYFLTTGDASDSKIGARVISPDRTGVIQFTDSSATSYPDVYQVTQSGSDITYVPIAHSCAKLQNGDHSYTQSAPGNTYVYDKVLDAWSASSSFNKKTGLFQTLNNDGTLKTVYLKDDVMQSSYTGLLYYSPKASEDFTAGDDQYYYIKSGVVVRNKGWLAQSNKHYYIHENYAYKSMTINLGASEGLKNEKGKGFNFACRYTFGDDASLTYVTSTASFSTAISSELTIQNGVCYYNLFPSLPFGVGLFEQKSGSDYFVYLAKEDGTLVKNATYYVSPTQLNSIKDSKGKALTAGLYYFDAEGKMKDSSFKTISRTGASL